MRHPHSADEIGEQLRHRRVEAHDIEHAGVGRVGDGELRGGPAVSNRLLATRSRPRCWAPAWNRRSFPIAASGAPRPASRSPWCRHPPPAESTRIKPAGLTMHLLQPWHRDIRQTPIRVKSPDSRRMNNCRWNFLAKVIHRPRPAEPSVRLFVRIHDCRWATLQVTQRLRPERRLCRRYLMLTGGPSPWQVEFGDCGDFPQVLGSPVRRDDLDRREVSPISPSVTRQ